MCMPKIVIWNNVIIFNNSKRFVFNGANKFVSFVPIRVATWGISKVFL